MTDELDIVEYKKPLYFVMIDSDNSFYVPSKEDDNFYQYNWNLSKHKPSLLLSLPDILYELFTRSHAHKDYNLFGLLHDKVYLNALVSRHTPLEYARVPTLNYKYRSMLDNTNYDPLSITICKKDTDSDDPFAYKKIISYEITRKFKHIVTEKFNKPKPEDYGFHNKAYFGEDAGAYLTITNMKTSQRYNVTKDKKFYPYEKSYPCIMTRVDYLSLFVRGIPSCGLSLFDLGSIVDIDNTMFDVLIELFLTHGDKSIKFSEYTYHYTYTKSDCKITTHYNNLSNDSCV